MSTAAPTVCYWVVNYNHSISMAIILRWPSVGLRHHLTEQQQQQQQNEQRQWMDYYYGEWTGGNELAHMLLMWEVVKFTDNVVDQASFRITGTRGERPFIYSSDVKLWWNMIHRTDLFSPCLWAFWFSQDNATRYYCVIRITLTRTLLMRWIIRYYNIGSSRQS